MPTLSDLPHPLTPREAEARLKQGNVRLIDVREPSEFAAGRIAGSQLAPVGSIQDTAKAWDRGEALLVYCQSGRRSERARAILAELGFLNVDGLDGGIAAWSAAGLPTVKSQGAPWSLERQVRFTVGLFVIAFTSAGLWVHPGFFILDFLIAGGLIFSAVTNTCGMALVLTKLPWNKATPS